MSFGTRDSRLSDVYLRINKAVESAIEFDIDRHHGFTALDIKTMNMRGMIEIVIRGNLTIKSNCILSHQYIIHIITPIERRTYLQ